MRRLIVLVAFAAGCSSTPSKPHLEMYNVQDLVSCEVGFGTCRNPDAPEGCNQFEKKAKLAVSPTAWDEEKGYSLIFQSGLLIVRADDDTQKSVRSFLSAERAKTSSEVK